MPANVFPDGAFYILRWKEERGFVGDLFVESSPAVVTANENVVTVLDSISVELCHSDIVPLYDAVVKIPFLGSTNPEPKF